MKFLNEYTYDDLEYRLLNIGKNFEINYGGCGIFALEVYKKLKEHNINCEICVLSNKNQLYYNNIRKDILTGKGYFTISKLSKNDFWISHIIIKYDELYFDSKGKYNKKELLQKWKNLKIVKISFEDLKKLTSRKEGWNENFDRKLKKTLQLIFDESFK